MTDDEHASIVTITDIGGGNNHISATVPVNPLSEDLEKQYDSPAMEAWSKELNPFLKHSLKGKFVERIKDGHHMVSSQLPVPGLRNAALEHTFVVDAKGADVRASKQMLRSGTPAHNNGKGSPKLRDTIAGGRIVDMTVLNSDTPLIGDKEIVGGVRAAIDLYGKKMLTERQPFLMMGSKDGSRYSQKGIFVSHNKTPHLREIVEAFEAKKNNEIQWLTCKSGKDRTQAAATQNVLVSIEEVEGIDLKEAQAQIVRAGHGNAVAANVGATTGINGTKISNVFTGLAGDSVLKDHEDQLKTKICDLNHVEFKPPESLVLPSFRQARDIAAAKLVQDRQISDVTSLAKLKEMPSIGRKGAMSQK